MTTNPYDVGDVVRLSTAITDSGGDPVVPGTLTLLVEDPAGDVEEIASGDMQNPSPGNYYYDYGPLELSGYYQYRWVSTGAGAAASQGRFWARAVNVVVPA